jgi:hypothetical protein
MNTLALLLLLALGIVCLGIPLAAVVVVCRDELSGLGDKVRRALAFDPRHPDLDYHFGR